MKTRFGLEQKKNPNTRIEPAQWPTQRQKQKDTDKMGKFASTPNQEKWGRWCQFVDIRKALKW